MKKLILSILLMVTFCTLFMSSTWYVNTNAGGDNDGTSQYDAFTDLDSLANDHLATGDVVILANETYTLTANSTIDLSDIGTASSPVTIYGTENTVINTAGYNWFNAPTATGYVKIVNLTAYHSSTCYLVNGSHNLDVEMVTYRGYKVGAVDSSADVDCYDCMFYQTLYDVYSRQSGVTATFRNCSWFSGEGSGVISPITDADDDITVYFYDCAIDGSSGDDIVRNSYACGAMYIDNLIITSGIDTTGCIISDNSSLVESDPGYSVSGSVPNYDFTVSSTSPVVNAGDNGIDAGALIRLGVMLGRRR